MSKYKVRVYEATAWSMFSQADHYSDYTLTSSETLKQIAQRLAQYGSAATDQKWIMPGAILTVEIVK